MVPFKPTLLALFVTLSGLFFLLACGSGAAGKKGSVTDSLAEKDSTVTNQIKEAVTDPWIFEQMGSGVADEPLTKISIVVGKQTYLVEKSVQGSGNILEKSLWPEYKIPAKANSACMVWWAGQGDIFYLLKQKEGFQIFHSEIGEGMDLEKDLKYKKTMDVTGLIR